MKLVADSGLWSTGPLAAPTPLVAVLEVSGALLSWPVGDADIPTITFTDLARADWLWRVLGEAGHRAVAAAVDGRLPERWESVEVTGVGLLPGSVDHLRRLAFGHWMRRWWPASHRDGIAALEPALLDAEVALLTAAAQDFFPDDTFDSDIAALLTPHAAALNGLVRGGDPRVVELVRAASELTDDVGIALADFDAAAPRRDDYALAAGWDGRQGHPGAIAWGIASLSWAGVPPGIFDAAENTVDWRVEAAGPTADSVVGVALSGTGSPRGIAVGIRAGDVSGAGVLDDDGSAKLPLVGSHQQPVSESDAWNHDWRTVEVSVGVPVQESQQTRERVRDVARARLRTLDDAFLAEILAAESDY